MPIIRNYILIARITRILPARTGRNQTKPKRTHISWVCETSSLRMLLQYQLWIFASKVMFSPCLMLTLCPLLPRMSHMGDFSETRRDRRYKFSTKVKQGGALFTNWTCDYLSMMGLLHCGTLCQSVLVKGTRGERWHFDHALNHKWDLKLMRHS